MNQTSPGTPALRRSPASRFALLVVGWLSVGLGVVGMFVPLLPTTCFLLLGGACFARSSPRASHWLHTNRLFGRYLRDYREERVVPLRIKVVSLGILWLTIGATIYAVDNLPVRIGLIAIAAIISLHVGTTASKRATPGTVREMATNAGD